MSELIQGAGGGGGGKGGGGKSVTPTEQPDSLRSKQYARVIDLISEGEIDGLVNGLQSVYLDDTPVQNSDGSLNFNGLVLVTREGTQSQPFVPGFSASEAETAVVTEIKAAAPVVRSISNSNADAARVTISIPQLSSYDVKGAILGGTSVSIKVEIQSNGGGYCEARLRTVPSSLLQVDAQNAKTNGDALAASVTVNWTGTVSGTPYFPGFSFSYYPTQSVDYTLQYRAVGAGSWITLKTGTFTGAPYWKEPEKAESVFGGVDYGFMSGSNKQLMPPAGAFTVSLDPLVEDEYEFRVLKNSGTGTLSCSGTSIRYTGSDTITGKAMSRYQRSYRIPLEGASPWDIRITRLTADSTSTNLRNETWWDSYTEIVDAKLRYPNSALVALSVDAEQFRTIPKRGYEIRGIKVRIPSNYNPVTRVYTGIWNGNFVTAWTDNPAWCFYDLLTNDRYGLGAYLDAAQIDKWTLYQIGQYCDQMVPSGLGGEEPRFTCNLYLQTQEEAYNVIVSMASIFRAMVYWNDGAVTASQDAPSDVVALFSPANVIAGAFNYSGSSIKTRHTVALVSWNDPADRYRQKIEYVEDADGIALYGVQQTSIVALGCTSRGQAHRLGRWLLYSERLETETITFRAGLDGLGIAPGEIIQTTDPVRAGVRHGGRILAATTLQVTLDANVTIAAGQTYTLWAMLPDDTVESRTVTNAPGAASILTVSSAFSAAPSELGMWALAASNVEPETWRVISITEVDGTQAEITALAYDARKYDAVEQGLVLEPKPSSLLTIQPASPSNISVTESLVLINPAVVGARVTIGWTGDSPLYEVRWRVGDGNFNIATMTSASFDIQPAEAGVYEIRITAISAVGVRSATTSVSQIVYGLAAVPGNVQNFQMAAVAGMAFLSFDKAADLDVLVGGALRVRHSSALTGARWNDAMDIGTAIPGSATTAVLPLLSGTYMAKWVDSSGNESGSHTAIVTDAPTLLSMNAVESITENPSFSGGRTGLVIDTVLGGLKLDSLSTIDGMTGTIDTWPYIDTLGGIRPTGSYIFANSVDLGAVYTSRVSIDMQTESFNAMDFIDMRLDTVDTWSSVDGGTVSDTGVRVLIRTTNDNPAGSPTWSPWGPFFVGDWTARAFQFKAELFTDSTYNNIILKSISVDVDMPDLIDSAENIISGAGVKSVTYNAPFKAVKGLAITAENMATGDYYVIANKTTAGFDITFKNSAGTNISRTFDYIARGY